MACRSWGALLGALVLFSAAGCSLPRSTIGATGGFDAGRPDVGGGVRDTGPRPDMGVILPDGGVGCPTSCDDGNPCTDDGCDSTETCTHGNNAASCDDGVLCNGRDTCGGGSCSVHDRIDPCPGASTCDPSTDTCMGCATSEDCPMPTAGMWSTCDFGADLCATTGGTQSRSVTSYTCGSTGACEAVVSMETQACTRASTDGRMCAAPSYGDWSACSFGTDPCTQNGMQVRLATTSYCAAGACAATDTSESQACTRTTDGMSCGSVTIGPWSTCMTDATCSGSGMQTRVTTTPGCMSGVCVQGTSTETQTCVAPSGATCGAAMCAPWGTCTQTMPGTCDRTGTQSRMCSTPICAATGAGASCTGVALSTEMQGCSASVSGVSCTTTSCTTCREAFSLGCRHGHRGMQRCSTTNGSCMDFGGGPFCAGFPSSTSVDCDCP